MMLAKWLSAVLLASVAGVGLACEHPPLVDIPEEFKNRREEARVREDTLAYMNAMNAYVNCLQAEFNSLASNATSLHKALLATRNNAAVAEVEVVVQLFEARVGPIESLTPTGEN